MADGAAWRGDAPPADAVPPTARRVPEAVPPVPAIRANGVPRTIGTAILDAVAVVGDVILALPRGLRSVRDEAAVPAIPSVNAATILARLLPAAEMEAAPLGGGRLQVAAAGAVIAGVPASTLGPAPPVDRATLPVPAEVNVRAINVVLP